MCDNLAFIWAGCVGVELVAHEWMSARAFLCLMTICLIGWNCRLHAEYSVCVFMSMKWLKFITEAHTNNRGWVCECVCVIGGYLSSRWWRGVERYEWGRPLSVSVCPPKLSDLCFWQVQRNKFPINYSQILFCSTQNKVFWSVTYI